MPTSVIPRSAISGRASASSSRATPSSGRVCAVASEIVCERVARVKSEKRRRNTTVLATRSARRMRRVTRSISATSVESSSASVCGPRPIARCPPIERRRTPTRTRRGSRLWASAWSWCPAARPSMATSVDSASAATWPTVISPRACSFTAVLSPTPHSRSTGSGCRKAGSSEGCTTNSPSGLATPEATLARNLVRATPTVIGNPDLGPHALPQPPRDLLRRPRDPPHAAARL